MFCNDPTIKIIMNNIANAYNGHSGCSMAYTMRNIEFIAKNNINEFKKLWITKNINEKN